MHCRCNISWHLLQVHTAQAHFSAQLRPPVYSYKSRSRLTLFPRARSAGSLRFIEALDDRRASFAVHMSNVQRAFFFNITHELRTPLNSIIGFNTLAMESGELTDFTNSFIKASLTSAEALLGLINQILDFAKFEGAKDGSSGSSDSIELSEDVWTIRQLIEQVTDISQKASSRGVELLMLINQPEHFNTKFVGDFFRLRQCCINLVDNAIKYSSNVDARTAEGKQQGQGGATAKDTRTALVQFIVDIRPVPDKPNTSQLSFEVKDNGVGIPADKQHALFVPFCQARVARFPNPPHAVLSLSW